MRFILYTRKSSEGDERQVQSIPDQNSVLTRLSEQLGLNIILRLEEARSAKQPDARPVFSQMLDMIQSGKADGILCWHLNRLTRNPVDSGTLSWLLQEGVIKSIRTPEREYRPDDNVVIMAVENAVSNQYIVDLRHSIRRAQTEKAARGWYPHKPPGGYLTNGETGEIEVDPDRFPILRSAWDLMLTGNYSVPEVHKHLTERGYRTRLKKKLGRMMTRSNLYKLFDHTFYLGEFVFSGELYQGKHRPMVTREEFQRVQELIHGVEPDAPKRHKFAYSGLIRCGGCGCMITAERKVKHYRTTNRTVTYTYYRCTRSKGCHEPCVTEAYIEGMIIKWLERCRVNPTAALWAGTTLAANGGTTGEDLRGKAAKLRSDLAKTESKLEGLYDLRLGGEISAEELRDLKAKYKGEASGLEQSINQTEHFADRYRSSCENVLGFAGNAQRAFSQGDDRAKREVAKSLAEGYLLTLGTLQIAPHPLLGPLLGLEPRKPTADMVQAQATDSENPFLCRWVDHIRTLLSTQDVSFPELECLQQVRDIPAIVLSAQQKRPSVSRKKRRPSA